MYCYLIWLLIVSIINSDPLRDRCVVREGGTRLLKCVTKTKSIARYRWDFVSFLNESETIYDSQAIDSAKYNFEIFCNQTYCNLKLIRARKDDSGKYMCLIGEIDNSDNLKLHIEIEVVVRGPIKKLVVARFGASLVLPCEHNLKNITRTRWTHLSTDGVRIYDVYDMRSNKQLNNNYEALCGFHQLSCNIEILGVGKESAGRYICMHGDSMEYERRYGLDDMTDFIEIDLVVGDLICNDYDSGDLTLVGENDCYGVEPDVLNLKCSFSYYGNIDNNLFHLNWIERHKFNFVEKNLISSRVMHESAHGMKIISIQTNLSVTRAMVNSSFQCILDNTNVTCDLSRYEVKYLKNTTEPRTLIYLDKFQDIKCSANKSENTYCEQRWFRKIGGDRNDNEVLSAERIMPSAIYACIAKCTLSKGKSCHIKALEVEVIPTPVNDFMLPLAILLVLIFGITACPIAYVVLKRKRKYRRLVTFTGRKKTQNNENTLNKNQILFFSSGKDLPIKEVKFAISKDESKGPVSSFAWNERSIFVSYPYGCLIDFYEDGSYKETRACEDLTEIFDLLVIDEILYVLGAYDKRHDAVIKIIKVSTEPCQESTLHQVPYQKGTRKLAKALDGMILFILEKKLTLLTSDGIEINTVNTCTIYDALHVGRECMYVLCIYALVGLMDYSERANDFCKTYPPTDGRKRSRPRCIAMNGRGDIYIGDHDRPGIEVLNLSDLSFKLRIDVKLLANKIIVNDEGTSMLVLTDKRELLRINTGRLV